MSAAYWEDRYRDGGNSGSGSGGDNAIFKATFLNALVSDRGIRTVIEFGCGDGRQLALADYPDYLGLDVSPSALALCREKFDGDETKQFRLMPCLAAKRELALSLDVIYHLVEDDIYEEHLRAVFAAAIRLVVLYTSDQDEDPLSAAHVRHRHVSADVRKMFPTWWLSWVQPGPEEATFFVYERPA